LTEEDLDDFMKDKEEYIDTYGFKGEKHGNKL